MAQLFDPYKLRGIEFRNRIAVSPMCEYSSVDGYPNDWHLVHLGSRAVGGAGLVLTEAAGVLPEGRISPSDLGIYLDDHVPAFERITSFVKTQGARVGIQLAHAGRKASTRRPWDGDAYVTEDEGGWQPLGPSSVPAYDRAPAPHELSVGEIAATVSAFGKAAERAIAAGFEVLELHAAHGYLLHEFFSPLSNLRTDAYGGSFENRTRIARETVAELRRVMPESMPLFVRISATDWAPGGWDVDESVRLAKALKELGADLIDVSSGGLVRTQQIKLGPHYQVPFAERIRREADVPTGAVGLITEAHAANGIIENGESDIVLLAREMLRDPYWPLHAADQLGVDVAWPKQYERAKRER